MVRDSQEARDYIRDAPNYMFSPSGAFLGEFVAHVIRETRKKCVAAVRAEMIEGDARDPSVYSYDGALLTAISAIRRSGRRKCLNKK